MVVGSSPTEGKRGGAVVACLSHNQKVSGSKPLLAKSENDLKLMKAVVAQSVERKPFKLVAVGSSPTEGT